MESRISLKYSPTLICLVRRVNLPPSDSSIVNIDLFRFYPRLILYSPFKLWFMPIGLNLNQDLDGFGFNAFKHVFKACFLGWHFLTANISPRSSTPLSVRPIAI